MSRNDAGNIPQPKKLFFFRASPGLVTKRAIEWVKTALIALLAFSALILGWRTELFNDFIASIPLFGSVADLVWGGAGASVTMSDSIKEAARPFDIVITDEDGGRYGVRYDTDARNSVYDRTSSIIRESLGSFSELREISEEEWRAALSGPGVYFEYITPVKLSVLDRWLDARMSAAAGDAFLRRICVAFGEDRSRIYYQDHESGLFYGADTASAAGKAQELGIYSANGAVFAYETGIKAAEAAPYMLIMPGRDHPDIRASAAGSAEELLDIILGAMGIRRSETSTYYDSSGVLVCVGTQLNVRVDADGYVFYRRTEAQSQPAAAETLSESDMIERARVIAADTIARTCGGAEVFFDSLDYGAGESCSVLFTYYIAGGRIMLFENEYAARVTFTAGAVLEFELNFRNFLQSGEYTRLLPERLALAAAGGEFILCYSDTGAERLPPAWVAR